MNVKFDILLKVVSNWITLGYGILFLKEPLNLKKYCQQKMKPYTIMSVQEKVIII